MLQCQVKESWIPLYLLGDSANKDLHSRGEHIIVASFLVVWGNNDESLLRPAKFDYSGVCYKRLVLTGKWAKGYRDVQGGIIPGQQ